MKSYSTSGQSFINEDAIFESLKRNERPDPKRIKDILEKSLSIQTLEPDECAALLNTEDPEISEQIFRTASEIKKKVYDNRIVTFAPLYLSNFCVNSCLYCAFRKENTIEKRRRLNMEEVKKETEVLAGEIGHKRLIVVYGEHPVSNIDYMVDTIKAVYEVKVKTKNGFGSIRRVNVNAPSLTVEELKRLKQAGIGTYQVFQETYHRKTYEHIHPQGTKKGDYLRRLYTMHCSQEAGVDDVGIGVLFGLYDWKFEVMGLLCHSRELEKHFNIGPHTISFPRLQPAANTPFIQDTKYKVSDRDFKKLIAVIRLSVPYTGMILTAREPADIRREVIPIGTTQTDASTRIGIGAYSDRYTEQEAEKQQFLLGDTRSLDEVIKELAGMGYITSFCTAGYRCGRTGQKIMGLLRSGKEGWFCKLNAILTFREWLDDFASPGTKLTGEELIKKEIEEVKKRSLTAHSQLMQYYQRLENGERDLYF
ncbi:MAG: [FeFe] hydrogenase H-cluster radical SAM maturase HydG [Candidatus Omnitrophota bacterium]|nr:[FeFe] hydrogenase H-cluster radical SAM maturase HydG [Candidatus Omnitrophota bacterium]